MRRKGSIVVLLLCLCLSLAACGKSGSGEGDLGQVSMEWQQQYDLGIRLLNDGNYEEAILAFQAAIQIDPKNANAYCGLAEAYLYSGDPAKAQAALQDCLTHCDDAETLHNVASNLGFSVGEDGSIGGLTWQGQYDLGIRLLNNGNYEEAILAFQAAIQIDPKKADAYVSMADAYNRNGDTDKAMAALQDGLNYGDNEDWVRQNVKKMGFYVDENGNVYQMTEEESIAESLAALPVEEQVRYYTSQAGRDWEWCFEEKIQVFGQDARTITLEQLKTEALQRGWDSPYDLEVTRYSGVPFTYLTNGFGQALMYGQLQDGADGGVGFTLLRVGYESIWYSSRDDFRYQMEPGTDTGILNLQMGDSLETVLTKLGVPYAQQIAASALQWSGTEETRVTYDGGSISKHDPDSRDAADGTKVHETISIRYTNVGTVVNGHIQDSIQLEYRVYFKNVDLDTTLTLFFYGPEYELWFYEITNY